MSESPLLTIEVTDMNKPPLVKYKGQEIQRKKRVHYKWVTREGIPLSGKHEVEIEHSNHEDMTTEFIGKKRHEISEPQQDEKQADGREENSRNGAGDMKETALKIEYMREIREVLESNRMTETGVRIWGDRLERICKSIEQDFGLRAPETSEEGEG